MNRSPVRNSYRATHPAARRHAERGGTLLGIFIGLVIGLGMAAGVAFWLMRNNPAFQAQNNVREPSRDATKTARADAAEKPRFDFYKILPGTEEAKVQPERKAQERPDRAVVGEAKDRQAPRPAEAAPPPPRPAEATPPPRPPEKLATAEPAKAAGKPGERYWLQAGSFAGAPEAENLKARLALAGWEAAVQQGMMPDKALRYRVRLGPYDNADELNRMKGELGKRGFDVAVIKF
ncbi:MAG: SPOR domain-containing protein [Casimicrobiaceae bacterium]